MTGIEPGDLCAITHDIIVNGQIAFRSAEQVVLEEVDPNPQSPQHQYVVFSQALQKRFQLTASDLDMAVNGLVRQQEPHADANNDTRQSNQEECLHGYRTLEDGSILCDKCKLNTTKDGSLLPSIPHYCGECGQELTNDAMFCGNCGYPIEELVKRKALLSSAEQENCNHDFRPLAESNICLLCGMVQPAEASRPLSPPIGTATSASLQPESISCIHKYSRLKDGSLWCERCGANITSNGIPVPAVPGACAECGSEVGGESIVCGICGCPNRDIIARRVLIGGTNQNRCSHDPRYTDNGETICLKCGRIRLLKTRNERKLFAAAFRKDICINCGALQIEGKNFCEICGKTYEEIIPLTEDRKIYNPAEARALMQRARTASRMAARSAKPQSQQRKYAEQVLPGGVGGNDFVSSVPPSSFPDAPPLLPAPPSIQTPAMQAAPLSLHNEVVSNCIICGADINEGKYCDGCLGDIDTS